MSCDSIHTTLRYTIDTGIKPVNATVGPGGRLRQRTGGRNDDREVSIDDARAWAQPPTLDREGFALVEHRTAVADLWDDAQRVPAYDREIERLVAEHTGASRVVVFDTTMRSTDPGRQQAHYAREPVQLVHNDYTE